MAAPVDEGARVEPVTDGYLTPTVGVPGSASDAADEREIDSLRQLFRERRLSVSTMDRPLRLATAVALASLIGVVVLIALRNLHSSDVVVGRNGGIVVAIPSPLFIASLVMTTIGFAYLLSAAVLASRLVAIVSLLLITGAIGVEAGTFGKVFGITGFLSKLPSWGRWTTVTLLAAIWLAAAAVAWVRSRQKGSEPSGRLRLAVLGGYLLIIGGYFFALRLATPTSGQLDVFPQLVGQVMEDVVLVVTPMLLVAAVDFGEWGGLVGARLVAGLKGKGTRLAVPLAVTLSASLVVFGYLNLLLGPGEFSGTRLWRAAQTVLTAGVALVLVVLVGRSLGLHRRAWPKALNFAVIFAGCAVGTYLLAPLAGTLADRSGPTKAPEQVTEQGQFTGAADVVSTKGGLGTAAYTILIPRSWNRSTGAGVDIWTQYGVPGAPARPADPPFVRVAVSVMNNAADALRITSDSGLTVVGRQVKDGPWTRVGFEHSGGVSGYVWARSDPEDPQVTFLLQGVVRGVALEDVRLEFEAVAGSFRPSGTAPASLPAASEETPAALARRALDRFQSVYIALAAALLLGLLAVVATVGRRWHPLAIASVLAFGMTTVGTLVFFDDSLGRVLIGSHTRWPYLSQYGLLLAVGGLGLIALAVATRWEAPTRRRLITGLITLDATVWALQGMVTLYNHALSASQVSAWAAVTILVAIAWDVTMSGESLTNHGSKNFPRATRLLAFLGYVVLLAATVLFYSTQRGAVNGQATETFFEPEAVTRSSLFRVGLPIAVLLFLLRFGRRRAAATPDAAPVVAGAPV